MYIRHLIGVVGTTMYQYYPTLCHAIFAKNKNLEHYIVSFWVDRGHITKIDYNVHMIQ